MPTSEHRGHLGLSRNGAGIRPPAATRRSPPIAPRVAALNSSVEDDTHSLAALGEIQCPLRAGIAVLLEKQPLNANLHTLRLVGTGGGVRALAALVVDRHDGLAVALHHVDLRDHDQAGATTG